MRDSLQGLARVQQPIMPSIQTMRRECRLRCLLLHQSYVRSSVLLAAEGLWLGAQGVSEALALALVEPQGHLALEEGQALVTQALVGEPDRQA